MGRAKKLVPNKGLLGGVIGTAGNTVGGLTDTLGNTGEL